MINVCGNNLCDKVSGTLKNICILRQHSDRQTTVVDNYLVNQHRIFFARG